MHQVLLKNGTQFTCKPNVSILDNSLAQGITLEHGCKTGRCGACATQVLWGRTTLLTAETSLTDQARAQGMVLTCCRAAAGDLALDTQDLTQLKSFTVKTYPARIDFIEKLNHSVVKVVLRTPPSNRFEFLSGQYVSVIAADGTRRSYSMANAPRVDGKIELHIKKVDAGAFSQYWFEHAKANDLLRFEGPLGTFFMRQPMPQKLLFLATGTGLAPIKAILQNLNSMNETPRPEIHLYWGNRHENDIYTELTALAGTQAVSHLLLSQPTAAWAGRKGYVQQAVLEDKHNLKTCAVYACGSLNMIESARAALLESGLPSQQFYSDAFVSSKK